MWPFKKKIKPLNNTILLRWRHEALGRLEFSGGWSGISEDKMMPFIQTYHLSEIVNFVIKNYKPSIPSNLDEAAEKNFETMEVLEHENIFEETHRKIFKAGAEWVAGQGITIDGEVIISHGNKTIEHRGRYGIQETTIPGIDVFNVGDKVVVQIRKK